MTTATNTRARPDDARRHTAWVRTSHWIATASLLTLAVTGFVILMAHPRLYWGHTGNDLTPALIEFPITPGYRALAEGWSAPARLSEVSGAVTANRTYEPFNQNGWARSLHFLAAWWLVLPGIGYLLAGIFGGHFRSHIWPRARELTPRTFWQEIRDHLRLQIPPAAGGPRYGLLQKTAYSFVIFVAGPLILLTGITMAPAVTAAFPSLLGLFGGYQSARTIHFAAFGSLVLFLLVHVMMVALSGFRRQIRAMTIGERR